MKKFLALIAIALFVFVGCIAEETTLLIEEDPTTTPDVVVEDTTTVLEGVEFVSNEERIKALDEKAADELASDIQIGEDHQVLQAIMVERDLTEEDCELVKDPAYKEDCLMSI